jgi:hypothetical protein
LALRLSEIDELTRVDHSHLADSDRCYFIGEYTARAGFSHSSTNDLILNFKKSPSRRSNEREWRHKVAAVQRVAQMFREVLDEAWLQRGDVVSGAAIEGERPSGLRRKVLGGPSFHSCKMSPLRMSAMDHVRRWRVDHVIDNPLASPPLRSPRKGGS